MKDINSHSAGLGWKIKPYLGLIFKLILVFGLGFVLWKHIVADKNVSEIWSAFVTNVASSSNVYILIIVVLLIPVNWILETFKWKCFTDLFQQLPFKTLLKSVIGGITLSIMTPNRIGEYGGRIVFLPKDMKWEGIMSTIMGSYTQLIVLLSCGMIGMSYFMSTILQLEYYAIASMTTIVTLFVLLMLFCFFNLEVVIPLAKKIPGIHRLESLKKYIKSLAACKKEVLNKALLLAFVRYLVYSFQYFLLLSFFGVDLDLPLALVGISSIYLIQTSIPLPPLVGLIAKGEIAIFVWQYFGANEISVLAATYTIYLLNLIIPAIIGLIFILETNILKSFGYESHAH